MKTSMDQWVHSFLEVSSKQSDIIVTYYKYHNNSVADVFTGDTFKIRRYVMCEDVYTTEQGDSITLSGTNAVECYEAC